MKVGLTRGSMVRRSHLPAQRSPKAVSQGVRTYGIAAGTSRPGSPLQSSLWLRDICNCPQCIDQSSGQKLFQTCDLPLNVQAKVVEEDDVSIRVMWENDLAIVGRKHISVFDKSKLSHGLNLMGGSDSEATQHILPQSEIWDGNAISRHLLSINIDKYQKSEGALLKVLQHLKRYGLVRITGVPCTEDAVESVGGRIGHLRDTFYGRTWDVRSVPKAKNVAYTSQFLGFHMDLMYMNDPPGLQLLHCLKNTCRGGELMFADAFYAAHRVKEASGDDYSTLTTFPQTFQYRNAGQYYKHTWPTIVEDEEGEIEYVNWSPPFQGPFEGQTLSSSRLRQYVRAAKSFSSHVEAPHNIYEYRWQEGDCFIFNNRRVLHARRAFETATGERWLKGAYVDTDVFHSKLRVLSGDAHL